MPGLPWNTFHLHWVGNVKTISGYNGKGLLRERYHYGPFNVQGVYQLAIDHHPDVQKVE
jgi:hypothetical protein